MRILVTGGLGTVGAGLVADLRTRGHHVISCDIAHQPDEVGWSLWWCDSASLGVFSANHDIRYQRQ
jgi:nucleoside-diphosphate-sugar epimerase